MTRGGLDLVSDRGSLSSSRVYLSTVLAGYEALPVLVFLCKY